MNCAEHLDKESVAHCNRCSKSICEECKVTVGTTILCKPCAGPKVQRVMEGVEKADYVGTVKNQYAQTSEEPTAVSSKKAQPSTAPEETESPTKEKKSSEKSVSSKQRKGILPFVIFLFILGGGLYLYFQNGGGSRKGDISAKGDIQNIYAEYENQEVLSIFQSGQILIEQGDVEGGINLFRKGVKMYPNEAVAHMDFGRVLYSHARTMLEEGKDFQGHTATLEAEQEFIFAIEIFKDNNNQAVSECYSYLSDIYGGYYGDDAKSRLYNQKALEYNPNNLSAINNR